MKFWLINISINEKIRPSVPTTDLRDLANITPPSNIPVAHFRSFFLLCFWGLWNHIYDMVFRHLQPCLHRVLRRCIDDATLWAERIKRSDRIVVLAWKNVLQRPKLLICSGSLLAMPQTTPFNGRFRWGTSPLR